MHNSSISPRRRGALALFLVLVSTWLAPPALAQESRLVGTWIGKSSTHKGQRLVLGPDGKATLGELALAWSADENTILCTADGETLRVPYRIIGSSLTLTIEGERCRFRRLEEKAEEKAGPSATQPVAPGTKKPAPPPLEGVSSDPGTPWKHPRGWYSLRLPRGWSVAQENEEGILVNPGLGPQDTLDALILVTHGQLESDERGLPIDELAKRYEGEVRALMAQQGIQLERAAEPPRRVLVGDVAGCEQQWTGRTTSGQAVSLWLGAIAKREYFLVTLGLVVDGQSQRFLPGIKRIFTSLEPTPPERNVALEAAFVGHRISSSEVHEGGSFRTFYNFGAGGSVQEEMMLSGGDVGGSTQENGRYEVVGDELYLFFSDGQKSGQVLLQGQTITGVRFGSKVYAFR